MGQWRTAMLDGDFPVAWATADAWLQATPPQRADDPAQPYHLRHVWTGAPLADRDVLVRCYHGLGDTVQYLRFLPALRRRARRIILELQSPILSLLPLVEHEADDVRAFDPARPLPPAQCDVEIMELCHALRLHPAAVPPPYIRLPPAPPVGGTCVGLCWRGGGWDASRDIPPDALARAVAPLAVPIVGLVPDQANALPTMRDTADRIAATHVVVTVDTMIAHLAGAMNHPTILLAKADADWRWGRGDTALPWYPRTRILRQHAPGDWSAPLAQLADAVRAAISAAAG